jgi:CheY-specific phosphatase CheX
VSEPLKEAVIASTMHVLETSAFMSAWPCAETEQPDQLPLPDIAASMTFRGHCRGRFTLRLSSALLPLLTENMLGEAEEAGAPGEKGRDALKELLNMICGNVLTAWQGDAPVFDLSPPEILDETAAPETAPGEIIHFVIEETRADVEITLLDAVPVEN